MESSSSPPTLRVFEAPEAWPEFVPLIVVVRALLSRLPNTILYHDVHHTVRDVFPTAVDLALREGCSRREAVLIGVAALFHDVGYLDRYADNEPIGARYAREELPRHGFTADEIDAIECMILATRVPQRPNALGERILCDADLAHLGTDLCFLVGERLRLERGYQGEPIGLRAWYEANIHFLGAHSYHTASARALWQATKERNLLLARQLLSREDP